MSKSSVGFESELRVSPRPVIAALLVLAVALVLVSDMLPGPPNQFNALVFAALFFALSAIIWQLDSWKPEIGRWFTIIALVTVVHLGASWLDVPGLLTLLVVPIALAAPLINPGAATIVAAADMVLLVLVPRTVAAGVNSASIAATLIAICAMLGVMHAVYRPVHKAVDWSWEYFQRSRSLLQEAQDRKAELARTMDSLVHANLQLAKANERMAGLRMIAEEAQKTKTMFLAKVSHEFRTPLNMIIGLVELMAETPEIYATELPPEMEKDLGVVLRNCRHLSSMINDVLDLTRMETGRVSLHKEWVDLGDIIDEAVTSVLPLVEKKRLALQIAVPGDLPAVHCDRTRIRQVILNLVSNASRFTEKGRISIDAVACDQHVVVRVTDTGPGIRPEDRERIFEPFSQGMSDIWRDKEGSGLGLSISQQFIKLHHGRLWVESEVGVGSSFIFELPTSPPMEYIAGPGHLIREDWIWREKMFRTDRAGLADQSYKPRVVVCDGTGGLYSELARYLDEIDLVRTRDLSEAIQEIHDCPANAVMLNATASDDLLPLVERVRLEVLGTPVIGCSVPAEEERAIVSGAIGYLMKPVSHRALEEVIRAVGRPVRRVLVVDDDPDVLRLFTRLLHVCDAALEVETACSGERALDKLRSMPFDLMLLDVIMPDMDGWQVLELLREDRRTGNLSIFFVSAQDPADQPPASNLLLATIDGGLSIRKLLRCSLELSALLLTPDGKLDPTPPQTAGAGQASTGRAQRLEPVPGLPL